MWEAIEHNKNAFYASVENKGCKTIEQKASYTRDSGSGQDERVQNKCRAGQMSGGITLLTKLLYQEGSYN